MNSIEVSTVLLIRLFNSEMDIMFSYTSGFCTVLCETLGFSKRFPEVLHIPYQPQRDDAFQSLNTVELSRLLR
jgi:hypothetical protein